MSKVLKDTLIAGLIWCAGVATQTGNKYPRSATALQMALWFMPRPYSPRAKKFGV